MQYVSEDNISRGSMFNIKSAQNNIQPLPFVFSASRTASPDLGNCHNMTQH